MLAGPKRRALDLGEHSVADPLDHPRAERRADDRVVREHAVAVEPAVVGQQRQSAPSARTARRPVDLAVGEDRDVALVRAVVGRPGRRRRSSRRCPTAARRRDGGPPRVPSSARLDLAAGGDQLRQSLRRAPTVRSRPPAPTRRSRRRRRRPTRTPAAGTSRAMTNDGHVAEAHARTGRARANARDHAARRHVDRDVGVAVVGRLGPDRTRTAHAPSAIVP